MFHADGQMYGQTDRHDETKVFFAILRMRLQTAAKLEKDV
jgi:hypothetical protein